MHCGACGSRLIITNAKNRYGCVYPYFVCVGRHQKRNDCTAKAVLIDTVEDEVIALYEKVVLSPELRTEVETRLESVLAAAEAGQANEREQLETRLREVKDHQAKLLQAHYAGAVPIDLLTSEQQRLAAARSKVEQLLEDLQVNHEKVRRNLGRALDLVENCGAAYRLASPTVRRMFNQALFDELYVTDKNTVGELAEPFRSLFQLTGQSPLTVDIDRVLYKRAENTTRGLTPVLVGQGLKEGFVAHLLTQLSNLELPQKISVPAGQRSAELRRDHRGTARDTRVGDERAFVADLLQRYEAGETVKALAAEFGMHHRTIKKRLESAGATIRIREHKLTDRGRRQHQRLNWLIGPAHRSQTGWARIQIDFDALDMGLYLTSPGRRGCGVRVEGTDWC